MCFATAASCRTYRFGALVGPQLNVRDVRPTFLPNGELTLDAADGHPSGRFVPRSRGEVNGRALSAIAWSWFD